MQIQKKLVSFLFVLLFLINQGSAFAAFDVQGVQLFRDNTICTNQVVDGVVTKVGFNLSSLTSNSESVQSKVSSSGSLCSPPPFFTGGAILTTSPRTIQAEPNVQSLGRGILISEVAGNSSGVSSSGDPSGFSSLVARIGNVNTNIFEISLPTGCDVVDDDDDIVGASSDLITVNDFSLPTCTSTNGLTVQCSAISGLLTASNGLVPATSTSPAKVRFTISAFETAADGNMIDSILIRFDSQDIFCPSTISGPLTASIIAKNAIDSPTKLETVGSGDLGTPTQALKVSYVKETATSLKGETSINEIGTTAVLSGNTTTTLNTIQIEELNNESIPIGGQTSAILINPSSQSNAETNLINLWIIPSSTSLFISAPSTSDVTFSDNSLVVNSAPYIVKTNSDDSNAPFGTIVIPVRKNLGATDPSTIKTTITIKNIVCSAGTQDSTISISLFEPSSGGVVNTPGALSINNISNNSANPQNFSAFSVDSTRAMAQNTVVGGAVNESTSASQVITDADISALTTRDTNLGAPQIVGFTKVVSSVTPVDVSKITVETSGASLQTINAGAGSSIPGAKVKIDSIASGQSSAFDSVTITSKSDGSFTAKLQADFSKGDTTLKLKQTVSGSDSTATSKVVSQTGSTTSTGSTGSACDKTVCGCENTNCTPTVTSLQNFIKNNGGLGNIVSIGGTILEELIKSAKIALGLS